MKAKCIDNEESSGLTVGKTYEVTNRVDFPNMYELVDDRGILGGYYKYRFEVVDELHTYFCWEVVDFEHNELHHIVAIRAKSPDDAITFYKKAFHIKPEWSTDIECQLLVDSDPNHEGIAQYLS